MAKIHVLGASGSGTTTIAKVLAKKLGYVHLDTDSYFWEETDIPFTKKRAVDNRIALLREDLQKDKNVILSGIFYPWGDELTKYFDCLIHIETASKVRMDRLIRREYEMYGNRMLKGGDMYFQFKRFLNWALDYEKNTNEDIGQAKTEEWIANTHLRVIKIDGEKNVEENIDLIQKRLDLYIEER